MRTVSDPRQLQGKTTLLRHIAAREMHWAQDLLIIGGDAILDLGFALTVSSSLERFSTSTQARSMLGLLRPVPVNWDVILVEQEAKATERSAVEEVLAADIRWVFG